MKAGRARLEEMIQPDPQVQVRLPDPGRLELQALLDEFADPQATLQPRG